ncbi:MAG: hypothetical protein JRH20_31325 [Deltaproteobacteria bacterium]|nr:hypothetical protein [Deltaproteobacteria bacterium]
MFSLLAVGAVFLALSGCEGRGSPPFGGPSAPDSGVIWPDGMAPVLPPAPECTRDEDCGGGVCVADHCCASAERACGNLCCATGQSCFANACVDPGGACRATADCGDNEYCEPSLADESILPLGGEPPQHACVQPAPGAGRCLALPPRCPPGEDRDDCLPTCEVHSEAGKLAARREWSWNEATVESFGNRVDVWSTPVVGRVTDSNCDGRVDELDPPNVIFIAGNVRETCCQCTSDAISACHTGALRVLDGNSGKEVFSCLNGLLGRPTGCFGMGTTSNQ